MLTLERISSIGSLLYQFLRMFADCFSRRAGRQLLKVYVQGQLSDIKRKNCESIALTFGKAPRTLQRLLESIKWDEERLRDRCQQIIARDHAHHEAIGLVDESGTHKSGSCTVGASRQYNGNRVRLKTAPLVFIWRIRLRNSTACSTANFTCHGYGPRIRCVVKKLRSRRR